MDRFTQIAGFVMIGLMLYVAISTAPPVGEAVMRTFVPEKIDMLSIVTLVGGTVGGYIVLLVVIVCWMLALREGSIAASDEKFHFRYFDHIRDACGFIFSRSRSCLKRLTD